MKRSGFTMIELIFVIVILGILAAVALPKFIGVSEQAQEGKVKAYVGTLNRTIAPALWSDSITKSKNGTVKVAADNYSDTLVEQLETPKNIGDTAAVDLDDPVLTACTNYAAAPVGGYTDAAMLAWGIATDVTIGGTVYNVRCMDGSMNSAPRFILEKVGEAAPLVK